jgi:SAM-dependent methyltransferase
MGTQMVSEKSLGKGYPNYEILESALKDIEVSKEHNQWMWENAERIDVTVDLAMTLSMDSPCFAEIGPGGVGLAVLQKFSGATLEAYDCVDWFKPVYDQFDIPWRHVDLNGPFSIPEGRYDVIFMCEVIEHIAQWPVKVFRGLKTGLKSGGVLLVTTPNLHRLSNRLRMFRAKQLFADFMPESLVMGHIREYMPEEMSLLMGHAGFTNIETSFWSFPDLLKPAPIQLGYGILCKLFPRLSTHFYCMGRKPEDV